MKIGFQETPNMSVGSLLISREQIKLNGEELIASLGGEAVAKLKVENKRFRSSLVRMDQHVRRVGRIASDSQQFELGSVKAETKALRQPFKPVRDSFSIFLYGGDRFTTATLAYLEKLVQQNSVTSLLAPGIGLEGDDISFSRPPSACLQHDIYHAKVVGIPMEVGHEMVNVFAKTADPNGPPAIPERILGNVCLKTGMQLVDLPSSLAAISSAMHEITDKASENDLYAVFGAENGEQLASAWRAGMEASTPADAARAVVDMLPHTFEPLHIPPRPRSSWKDTLEPPTWTLPD